MAIGGSLFLIALGAIITFAIRGDPIGGVSLDIVGTVLMLVGLAWMGLERWYWGPRRRKVVQERVDRAGRVQERNVYDEGTEPPGPPKV